MDPHLDPLKTLGEVGKVIGKIGKTLGDPFYNQPHISRYLLGITIFTMTRGRKGIAVSLPIQNTERYGK